MISRHLFAICLIAVTSVYTTFAELPSELPGEEITQEYLKWILRRDTTNLQEPSEKKDGNVPWYVRVAKTWDAPPISQQMAEDKTYIPMGKGGVFIPRYSEAEREPVIEIMDLNGHVVESGAPGATFNLEPGNYVIMLGSGSHHQRIVRKVSVEESKMSPVMPDWSGLAIETVDTNATPFRGEYELVRIDEFEPYGRGFGADPDMGESVNTWVLKPGTYKILGRGESYNTLTNFITVRLLPGELVKLLLVQNPDNMAILGGGTVDIMPGKKITSHWKYGINIGGTVQFSGTIDRREDHVQPITALLSLRSSLWLRFNRNPYEWESSIRLDEGFNISDLEFMNITSGADDFRVTSLYIWRFLPWLGPYGRTELQTNLLPRRIKRDEEKNGGFCILDKNYYVNEASFDSTSQVFEVSPSFSPFVVDVGGGANLDAINARIFEAKIRLGAGSSYSRFPDNRYLSVDETKVKYHEGDSLRFHNRVSNNVILHPEGATSVFEFGPQGSINGTLRIGRLGTAGAELKVFAPVAPEMRFTRPDFNISATVSWRIARAITLDYDYNYQLKQPDDPNAQVNESTHQIWLRFSYTSR